MANGNPSQFTGDLPTGFPIGPTNTIAQLDNKNKGAGSSRFNSWFYCHEAFKEAHDDICAQSPRGRLKTDVKDHLALHLAFYLASWGMYRGSSFLLQLDYKAHLPVVEMLFDGKYDVLWDFDPATCSDFGAANALLFNIPNGSVPKSDDPKTRAAIANNPNWGLYWRIMYSYDSYQGGTEEGSDTLVTKILLGTLCCLPAYDRFFKAGVKIYKGAADMPGITANIENRTQGFKSLWEIVRHFDRIAPGAWRDFPKIGHHLTNPQGSYKYPTMKLVDMFFWNLGLGWGCIKVLCDKTDTLGERNSNYSDAEKIKAIETAIENGFITSVSQAPDADALSNEILTTFADEIARALI